MLHKDSQNTAKTQLPLLFLSVAMAVLSFVIFFQKPTPSTVSKTAIKPGLKNESTPAGYTYVSLKWRDGQEYAEPLVNGSYFRNGQPQTPTGIQTPQNILNHLGAAGWKIVYASDTGETLLMKEIVQAPAPSKKTENPTSSEDN